MWRKVRSIRYSGADVEQSLLQNQSKKVGMMGKSVLKALVAEQMLVQVLVKVHHT